MNKKIAEAFEKGKAFIPFMTCGDPSLEVTEQLVYAMEEAGADLIELGIPFSDPTAEGPVIQGANVRALSGGVTTDKVFDMVVKIRKNSSIPMVFMTYANVVFSYGTERFIKTAAEIGMNGLILPDVPFEEKEEFDTVCKKYGIDLISLIAPTSHERIAQIAKEAEGFVYCVSSLGVTGTRTNITTDIGAMVKLVKAAKDIPCAVGFGISTPEQAKKMAEQADVPYMVKSDVASGGSYNYAALCGIPSVLIERGQMGGWSPEEVHSMRKDVRNILCVLGVYDGLRSYSNYYPMEIGQVRYQFANVSGLWYPAKKPGDIVKAGEFLGCTKDFEGNVLESSYSDLNGVILYQVASLQVIKDGPMVTYGSFSQRRDERKEKITSYWTKRSDSFLEQRRSELHSEMAEKWLSELQALLPEQDGRLKILDVGCGAGFFSILLAQQGHEVTGIDLTPDMIVHSRELAQEEGVSCRFEVMDAENPDFADETFDVIVSRNLTWTLPNAAGAYKEWSRVLKKGGRIINVDANYGADDFADTTGLPTNHAHFKVGDEMMRECEEIKRQLPISSYVRPAWDLETLGKLGFGKFSIDLGVSGRIYTKKDEFYNPTPLFIVCAEK